MKKLFENKFIFALVFFFFGIFSTVAVTQFHMRHEYKKELREYNTEEDSLDASVNNKRPTKKNNKIESDDKELDQLPGNKPKYKRRTGYYGVYV